MRDGQAHFAVGPTPLPEQDAASIGGVCTEKGAVSLAAGIMPVGVAVKIEGISNVVLDAPTLAGIFTGDITRWDDPRITGLNAGQDFPDLEITVLLEEGPSETTRVMNDYLRSTPGLSWNPERADAWPSDVQGTSPAKAIERANKLDEDDGGLTVLEGNMIGNRFTAAQLIFDGQARKMDAAAVVEAVAAGSVTKSAQAVTQSLNSAAGYSLASVIYIHLCREYKEPALNRVVRSYGEHLLADRAQRDANIYAFTMSPKKQAINDGLALVRTIGEAQ